MISCSSGKIYRGSTHTVIIVADSSATGTGSTAWRTEYSDTAICYSADLYLIPEEPFIDREYQVFDLPPKTIKARSVNTKNFLTILKQPMARMGFKRGQRGNK